MQKQNQNVTIVSTGVANLASVRRSFERLGALTVESRDPRVIAEAGQVVLPGVGSFAAGMASLSQNGIAEALQARLSEGRPTLAICLGMQLLCSQSEESPNILALNFIPATVRRFRRAERIPQLGWNKVKTIQSSRFLEDGYAYYANSYCLDEVPDGWCGAISEHGEKFVAAIERDDILACQFHPELSGAWGEQLLRRWLNKERKQC